jgi:SAM-dependent methyltransferase
MTTPDFYNTLAPFYHLIYPDWQASITRQGLALDSIIRSEGGPQLHTVLDAACGIGTQSLGLAALGYEVTASDISAGAVERAQSEAQQRGLSIAATVADMRHAHDHHRRSFDVVLACDNSVPHLLSDAEILDAFRQFHACTAPGGICLVSARDYSSVDLTGPVQFHPYGVREADGARYVLFQVWEPHPPLYHTTFYVIEHPYDAKPTTHVSVATYYAVPLTTLAQLMEQAGFSAVRRIDEIFFQSVIVGRKLP